MAERGLMPILSWSLLAGASAVGALSALYVALAPAGDQTPLVGRSWVEFAAADPEMASIVSRLLVVLGLLGVGFGTLALLVILGPYRRAQRWAWNVLWLVPVVYAAIAVRQTFDSYPIAYMYGAVAIPGAVGLLTGVPTLRSHRLREPSGRESAPSRATRSGWLTGWGSTD
jgi:hypothetical protein